MAYVKQISINSMPKKMLKYILDINKTKGELVSTINTLPTINDVNNSLKKIFCQYYDGRYGDAKWDYTNTKDKTKKYAVKVHHFIQSFEEGTITPEVAHQLGEEWAKRCFGENAVVVVATHVDKRHIHNHFSVGSYTLDGKKINSNNDLLNHKYRVISDELCKEYNIDLSIIEKSAENKKNGKKNTYIEDNYIRPQGRSWKAQIEKDIDSLIPKVKSFEELLERLKDLDYTVSAYGKYVKVKPQGKDRFVRLKSLSSGYDEQSLKNKILDNLRSHVIVDTTVELTATITKKPLRQLLKENIDNAISQSVSFEDFLQKMKVEYTIKQGTHIAFRKDGYGQSFLRSKSIGTDYDEEHIKQRIEQTNINRKSEVVQSLSNAYSDNIVSLEGLKKKQLELKTKMGNLNKKVTNLSKQINQYDELKSISETYLKYADMPLSKMTILDTIQKQKTELILAKNGISNKQEFFDRLKSLEDVKHNYDIFKNELNAITKEYRKYTKLINDYNKVINVDGQLQKKNNPKR